MLYNKFYKLSSSSKCEELVGGEVILERFSDVFLTCCSGSGAGVDRILPVGIGQIDSLAVGMDEARDELFGKWRQCRERL